MIKPTYTKFNFRIRTRDGTLVDNLAINGRDEADAECKLRQMYHHCEILESSEMLDPTKNSALSFEDVAKLITD
jgi:hypothetical protein